MDLNDALATFRAEARGLLEEMEAALMQLERALDDGEALHAVFRAAHTIKGAAGLFGLDAIVGFTHHLETLLARLRDGSQSLNEGLAGLLLQCADHLGLLLDGLESGEQPDADLLQQGQILIAALQHASQPAPGAALQTAPVPTATESQPGSAAGGPDCWHLSLRFAPGVLREGFDPACFIHHLRRLGRLVRVDTVTQHLPALAELDAERCYLGFEIRLESQATKTEIEAVFEFVRQDCELRILPPDSRLEDYLRLMEELPTERLRLGEILLACGALTEAELARALQAQESQAENGHQPLGAILVGERAIQPALVQGAIHRQTEQRQRQAQEAKLIRVQSDKLDGLIERVAELLIVSSTVGVLALRNQDRSLREAVSQMSRLTEDVRDGAMRLRMVEIGETFARFRRLVRDVSKELDKEIELQLEGGETELDKSMVDRIGDPLTHLVRNAIDHGIEPAALRAARGKPAAGRLELRAMHEAGAIVIEVADDGGGLNRERILAKATEQGLVEDGAELSDQQVWALIFEPGFSTAEAVSNLSGRGVGMDVVKRSIGALRGGIEIDSRAGEGTRFRIRLPLTLAIIEGFLMAVGDSQYVVPLDAVLECVQLPAGARGYLDLRGEVLPLLRLREHFALPPRALRRENVVVVQIGNRKAGLVVDQLKGELQAVIKPLGPLMDGLPGLAGSTILGTGDVALMLDIPALIPQASGPASSRPSAALTPA